MRPVTSARIKRLPALIAASVLLALSLACGGGEPQAAPTPSARPTPVETRAVPEPVPTPGIDATVIAQAVATAIAGMTANATPVPAPSATSNPGAGSTPNPEPAPTPTLGEGNGPAAATATAAAVINAQAAALGPAVVEVIQQLMLSPDVRDQAIADASVKNNVDPDVLATAVSEAWDNPITPTPNAIEIALATANAESEANALATADARAQDYYATSTAMAGSYMATDEAISGATATAIANPTATYAVPEPQNYDAWNGHEWLADPKPWWRPSSPYNCDPPPNRSSPWTQAGLPDLGGQDPLSLIRYFGNGSYVRYGLMGFEGCTFMSKHPDRTHLDTPYDPTYYSLGSLEIAVDIARVPVNAAEWDNDNGVRVQMSMSETVSALNANVAAYFNKISEGKLRMSFVPGVEFTASGRGTPQQVEDQWLDLIGVRGCDPASPNAPGCRWGMPGALNRIFLNDVAVFSGGSAWNGYTEMGLVSLQAATMTTLIHEIGHAWMLWPHSYTELPWRPDPGRPYQKPNPYSNRHDFMSEMNPARHSGWHQDMPSTLAVNRYAAGWIAPEDVALHLSDRATYTLARPRESGSQFLVIHSGRRGAFTTLEVLDERNAIYRDTYPVVYDSATGQKRPIRYDGVLVSRYDQTTGTGVNARVGPALYNSANPNYQSDVGYGLDDYSVIADGESRAIGGGVTVSVTKNADGSYNVSVSGGRIASYDPWCVPIWFTGEYDTGCALDGFDFG